MLYKTPYEFAKGPQNVLKEQRLHLNLVHFERKVDT